MPRLGDDPNMATAYPDRVSTNLRGSWMRQFAMTMIGTIILYNLVFKDYKGATKAGMSKKGLEAEIESIIPKTPAEIAREKQMAKMTNKEKLDTLQYEVGNLTLAVMEIQKLLVESNGVTIEHPITLGDPPEGGEGGDENAVQGDGAAAGDAGVGGSPAAMLRGAEGGQEDAAVGNPGGGDNGEGGGDGGGAGVRRRLSSVATMEDPPGEKRPAGRGETAGNRLQQRQRRHLKGSPREEGGEDSRAERP